jgi:hypothetical protein
MFTRSIGTPVRNATAVYDRPRGSVPQHAINVRGKSEAPGTHRARQNRSGLRPGRSGNGPTDLRRPVVRRDAAHETSRRLTNHP